jgi:hypothetical protein
MADLSQQLKDHPKELGKAWVPPQSFKKLIDENKVRIAATDNALLIEIDGETWTLPDAFRLTFFRAGRSSGLLDV